MFSIKGEFRFEEGRDTRLVELTVSRGLDTDGVTEIGSAAGIATVNYKLYENSAHIGQDFRGSNGASAGQVVFAEGSRTAIMTVEIIDDIDPEMEEFFHVSFKDYVISFINVILKFLTLPF